MADEELEELEEQPSGGKKKIILLIVGVLLLVGASVGATIFFLGGGEPPAEEEVAEEPPKKAHYFSLDPPFVVNFPGSGRGRFLQVTLDAMTYDETVVDAVRTHMPVLRNNLILLFSEQDATQLITPEGKEALRAATLDSIQKVIEKETGQKGVENVYFTSFVMQ